MERGMEGGKMERPRERREGRRKKGRVRGREGE